MDLHKVKGSAKLTAQDISNFRRTIRLSLERDHQALIEKNVRIIDQHDDTTPMILARTIAEQQREKEALLNNDKVTEVNKEALRKLNPEDNIQNVIELDTLLDTINMELAGLKLPKNQTDDMFIYLNKIGLTRFPEALVTWLHQCLELRELSVSDNSLVYLPESFCSLTMLKSLSLSANNLIFLPETFGRLTKLADLYLDRNNLQTLPETFGNLMKLTILSIPKNHLRKLPASFGNLKNLVGVNLSDNYLFILPDSMGNLKLSRLNLENNKLLTLPASFANLTSLSTLPLAGNNIVTLPEPLKAILTKTQNIHLLVLLAPERPLTTQLLGDKFSSFFITQNQGKSIFGKISALNYEQLAQLSACITKKRLGSEELDDAESNVLDIFSISEEQREAFIRQCVKVHGNLFFKPYASPVHFKNHHEFTQHLFDNLLDVFYPQIKDKIDSQMQSLKPAPKKKRKQLEKLPSACSVSAHTRSKMKRSSKRHLASPLDERLLKKPKVLTAYKTKVEKRETPSEISWLTLRAMVEDVEALQRSLPVKDKFTDKASIDALHEVRVFLNIHLNDFEGLRALLTRDNSDEMMGIGAAVKVFKEPGVNKLYNDLFRALQEAPVRENVKKKRNR